MVGRLLGMGGGRRVDVGRVLMMIGGGPPDYMNVRSGPNSEELKTTHG